MGDDEEKVRKVATAVPTKKEPMWPVILKWNAALLIIFLAVPNDYKGAVGFAGFWAMLIHLGRRRLAREEKARMAVGRPPDKVAEPSIP